MFFDLVRQMVHVDDGAFDAVLREAIEKTGYAWRADGPTLPEAMLAVFRRTGVAIEDPTSGCTFRRLDLLAALDHVFAAEAK